MKVNFSEVARMARDVVSRHSPEILTGLGIAGMISAAVMAVRATPKAIALIDDEVWARFNESGTDMPYPEWLGVDTKSHNWLNAKLKILTPAENARLTWKCYIPAAVTGAVSIACLIGASSVNARRNAALATAYNLSAEALKEYRGKVIETIGEKKEQAVHDAIAKDKIDRNDIDNREVIVTKGGKTLCYDVTSARTFTSDMETLQRAVNCLNKTMLEESYVSLNDLYYEIGLEPTSVGNDLGWRVEDGLIDIHFRSRLTKDGTPCLVLDYYVAPKYNYKKY